MFLRPAETEILTRGGSAEDPYGPPITPAMVEFHYRRGRHLQAQAIASGFAWLFGRRRAAAKAPAAASAETPPETPSASHEAFSALATIRSTAELLRDHPDIALPERRRFLKVLLDEEARLETLLPKALTGMAPAR